jgi:filamin
MVTVSLPSGVTVGASSDILVTIPEEAGTGPLNVSVKAQMTPQPLEVTDNGNRTMTVKFTPRANGKHEFVLKWGEDAIAGSPFSIEVAGEVKRDSSKVQVNGIPTTAKANTAVTFTVVASDEAGPGPLMVDAEGPAEPVIDLQNTGGGNFSVSITAPKAGDYKLEINWSEGCAVPGSPFSITVTE